MLSKLKAGASKPHNDTPTTSRFSRTGWTPLVCEKGGTYQIRMTCQRKGGKRDLFTSAPAATKPRPSWAPIISCEHLVERSSCGDKKEEMMFTNMDNEKKPFSVDLLNPLIFGCNPFSQKCAGLMVEHKLKLLAIYYELLSKSTGFCSHKDGHDENGLPVAGTEAVVQYLVDNGGSVKDLKEFKKLAIENAFKFGEKKVPEQNGEKDKIDQNFRLSNCNKRKITDFFNPGAKKKLTKTDRIENNFREAIEEENGIEKSLVNSYVKFVYIKIEKLSVCPNLYLPVDEGNVRAIAESMEDQFDPVLAVLTVYPDPADSENYRSPEDNENINFRVICGQHKYRAMRQLIAQGKEAKMKGLPGGKIPCYVCSTGSAAVVNHANIRNNDINVKFKNTAGHEDLVFVFCGLAKTADDEDDAAEIVKRICSCRRTAPADMTALVKIIGWPREALVKLLVVLDKFKKFQTTDCVGGYGNKTKLKNRQGKTLTKLEFRQLGSCKPAFFLANYEKVLENEKSLREILKEAQDQNDLAKTISAASQVAGHADMKSLRGKYPEKFDESILKKFIGAEVFGKKKNAQGQLLANYIKSIKKGGEGVIKDQVDLVEISGVYDVDAARLYKYDVIVFNSTTKNMDSGYVQYLIDHAGGAIQDHLSVIILFNNEKQLQEALTQMEAWKSKPDFKVCQILYEKTVSKEDLGVTENLTFSLLFGKINVFGNNLHSLQKGPFETELNKVVSKVCCPSAKVAYISGGGVDVIRIHQVPVDNSIETNYFAPKTELEKFRKKFFINVPASKQQPKVQFKELAGNDRKEVDESEEVESDMEDEDVVVDEEKGEKFSKSGMILNLESKASADSQASVKNQMFCSPENADDA